MGLRAIRETEEDNLCARYMKDLLENKNTDYIYEEIEKLKITSGAKFFDSAQQNVFPQRDFYLSTNLNNFNFVLKVVRDANGDYIEKIDV